MKCKITENNHLYDYGFLLCRYQNKLSNVEILPIAKSMGMINDKIVIKSKIKRRMYNDDIWTLNDIPPDLIQNYLSKFNYNDNLESTGIITNIHKISQIFSTVNVVRGWSGSPVLMNGEVIGILTSGYLYDKDRSTIFYNLTPHHKLDINSIIRNNPL
jgi:hypothetical protein